MRSLLPPLATAFSLLGLSGCIHVTMDPIKVHAVVDVNVKMEKEVTDLLSDIYGDSKTVDTKGLASPTP